MPRGCKECLHQMNEQSFEPADQKLNSGNSMCMLCNCMSLSISIINYKSMLISWSHHIVVARA